MENAHVATALDAPRTPRRHVHTDQHPTAMVAVIEKEPTLIPPSGTGPSGRRTSKAPIIAAIVAGVLLIIGIRYFTTRGDDPNPAANTAAGGQTAAPPPRDGCTTVTIAASSEKAALLGEIANTYRDSGRTVDGRCFDIMVSPAASGTAETNLATGWDETLDGAQPDVWTPQRRPGSACCAAI